MEIICPNPNCGYKGKPKKVRQGSKLILILLFLFYIIPGVLYLLFYYGDKYYCPKCGNEIKTTPELEKKQRTNKGLLFFLIGLLVLILGSIIIFLISPLF